MNTITFPNVTLLPYKKDENVLDTGKTVDGKLYCHFIVKESRYKKSPATYHCSCFDRVAEHCMNMNLSEGDQISIVGELDPYINPTTKRTETRINVDKIDYAIKKAELKKLLEAEQKNTIEPLNERKINLSENDIFFQKPAEAFK